MNRLTRLPATAGRAARNAYARLRAKGIPTAPLLARAGLTRRQLLDGEARLNSRAQIEFLQLAADALSDDLFGFRLARDTELRDLGLLYFVLASSANLREVLQRGARYSRLANEGIVPEFVDGAALGYRIRYSGISRPRDCHQAEYWMTTLLRVLRKLIGTRLVPTRVQMAHPRSRGLGEMARYFGCPIEFGAGGDQILFARALRGEPVINADPFLNKLLVKFCEQAIGHRTHGAGPVRASVENIAATLLPHGRVTIDDVATQLYVGRRTLTRQLAAEGTTFSRVLDELRHDLARRHLSEGIAPISKIAWLLGFQGPAAFSHAFRRWSGQSPRSYKNHLQPADHPR